MTKPRQHLLDAFRAWPRGQLRPGDHDDGQAKLARGVDLGARAGATGISCDQQFDMSCAHQVEIAFAGEGAARDDHLGVRKRQHFAGRIDESQQVGMLRPAGERRKMLTSDRQKHTCLEVRQGGHRGIDVAHVGPAITGGLRPWRAFERDQRHTRDLGRLDGMAAHLRGKGMRCIDHMRDPRLADEIGKPVRSAETADPRRQRMAERNLRASRIGIDRIDVRARERRRELVRVACSAQNEGARHG